MYTCDYDQAQRYKHGRTERRNSAVGGIELWSSILVPDFSGLDMVKISVEFLIKIQPTPSRCRGGLND